MKILRSLLVLFLFLTVFSCRKENASDRMPAGNTVSQTPIDPAHVKALWLLGFDTTGAHYTNDGLMAGGDVLMDTKYLEQVVSTYKQSATDRHAHTNNLVTGNNTNITVSLQSNLVNDYSIVLALRDALTHLNNVSQCRLNFMYALTDANADINVYRTDDDNYYGFASWPNGNGQPGRNLYINRDLAVVRSHAQNVLLFVHEIGHAIGLRHADWDNIGEPVAGYDFEGTYGGATYIPGTPNSDAASVMNHNIGILNLSWNGFSAFDLVALRYLYPIQTNTVFESFINGPTVVSQSGQHNHTNGAAYGCGNYQWRLLDSNQQLVYSFYDEECSGLEWSNVLSPGTYYLQSCLKDVEAPAVWYSKTIIVQ